MTATKAGRMFTGMDDTFAGKFRLKQIKLKKCHEINEKQ